MGGREAASRDAHGAPREQRRAALAPSLESASDDHLRELLDRPVVHKWNWTAERLDTLFVATNAASINGTKATPC